MTTSGTVGTTTIDVTSFIEHAVRRCGVSASLITAEQQLAARENLYVLLQDLANHGVNLWCVQKAVQAVVVNQKLVNLPVGTVDLLRANYRTIQQPTSTPVSGAGYLGVDYGAGSSVAVMTVGLNVAVSANYSFVVESSPDGVTWTTQLTLTAATAFTAGTQVWYDLDNTAATRYWRVRDTLAASVAGSTFLFGSTPSEIPMAKLSRDDYVTLPNKDFVGRPLQYWYDKQMSQPRMWLWPVPNDASAQLVCWVHRHIQDVGSMTNTLELPARWYQTVLFMLAHMIAFENPQVVDAARRAELKVMADEHLLKAEDGERDGAPIRFAPRIGCYTA